MDRCYSALMKRKKQAGFSLIEVMIAIVILALVILGSAALVFQASGGIQKQQNKREAVVAANTVLERYWNVTYSTLLNDFAGSTETTTETVNGNSMTVTITFSNELVWDGESYIQILVDVDHATGEDIQLTSRRYEFGLSKASI